MICFLIMNTSKKLPIFICGPLIRRLTINRIVLWWVSTEKVEPVFNCFYPGDEKPFLSLGLNNDHITVFKVGERAFVHLADIKPENPFQPDLKIEYDLLIPCDKGIQPLQEIIPHILYPGQTRPSFMVRTKVHRFFHGSCRKPHYDSEDALTGLDREIEQSVDDTRMRPAFLMLTGDQIYADDVAGPMLQAIHQVGELLGLYHETFDQACIKDSKELYKSTDCYYLRKTILPRTRVGKHWYSRGGVKHIFSSSFAHNHMITFAEWLGMYFLVWSPALWEFVQFNSKGIQESSLQTWEKERKIIVEFTRSLPIVQRLLAHIPTYMIFDDHDITDDWNLTAQWEGRAYGHPFTRRIIGNGLMAYFLCQGIGNAPDAFPENIIQGAQTYFNNPVKTNHDEFVQKLLEFKHWHFEVDLFPELVVVDSRTRRWKRQRDPASPSGLIDWEALMKLQQKMMREDAVLLVSPAPIFGVKLIELIQRILTTFGYSLAVDAENWMSHRKCAYTLLEIFKNAKTASYNTIISGDVHYSFAYDIELRFTRNCPGIWQITSSGIKNEFPGSILGWLDRINQILYAPYSPFNWFTKRRDMIVHERIPKGRGRQKLINKCGIGRVTLDSKGSPVEIAEIYADSPPLVFEQPPKP